MARQLRVRATFGLSSIGSERDAAGRYRKRRALDCGRARCGLCSGHKLYGEPSHKDRIRRLRAEDSLREYAEGGGPNEPERRSWYAAPTPPSE